MGDEPGQCLDDLWTGPHLHQQRQVPGHDRRGQSVCDALPRRCHRPQSRPHRHQASDRHVALSQVLDESEVQRRERRLECRSPRRLLVSRALRGEQLDQSRWWRVVSHGRAGRGEFAGLHARLEPGRSARKRRRAARGLRQCRRQRVHRCARGVASGADGRRIPHRSHDGFVAAARRDRLASAHRQRRRTGRGDDGRVVSGLLGLTDDQRARCQ